MRSSIKKDPDVWEQLIELKAMTQEMGTLHEAQVMQLRMWAILAFPHADSVEVAVGLPHIDEDTGKTFDLHRVEYRVTATKKPPAELKKLLGGLQRSIYALLGAHFDVVAKVNGTTIFDKKGGRLKRSTFRQVAKRLKNVTTPNTD